MSTSQEIYIDDNEFLNEIELHEYFADVLQFPTYYGNTYASFSDCLEDIYHDVHIIFTCNEQPSNWIKPFIDIAMRISHMHPSLIVDVSYGADRH